MNQNKYMIVLPIQYYKNVIKVKKILLEMSKLQLGLDILIHI